MTITVLSKPSCVQCTATYRALDRKGIKYEVKDITADADALAQAKELGHMSAPVVVVSADGFEDSWGGFRPDRIDELAELLEAA